MSVVITTSLRDITIDLYTNRFPLTSKNFLKLCKIKYYNGCLFHKVKKDFAAQTGDPSGNGNGGDSIYKFRYGDQARFFSDEIHPDLKHSEFGTVAMASAEKNMNASQIGDIPDAEIKPPENVLFVCKLNSVTQDEDLGTIFSRFGNVLSTEIIRDYNTGDSLGYAFIAKVWLNSGLHTDVVERIKIILPKTVLAQKVPASKYALKDENMQRGDNTPPA